VETPWYRKAFGAAYPEIYAHRNGAEAEVIASTLAGRITLEGARVLDVACGAGRHLKALAAHGARVVGTDLSETLLEGARAAAPVTRGDMRRLPFRDRCFDGVINMFTSFGYFDSRKENLAVIDEIARVLRGGGWFLMDYLNPQKTIDRLVPESERMAGGLCIREKRKYDGETKILTKEVRIIGEGGKVRESWNERLLLFFPEDLEKILAAKGLKVRKRYGDYQGGEFRRETPRLLFFCVRKER